MRKARWVYYVFSEGKPMEFSPAPELDWDETPMPGGWTIWTPELRVIEVLNGTTVLIYVRVSP